MVANHTAYFRMTKVMGRTPARDGRQQKFGSDGRWPSIELTVSGRQLN